MENRLIFFRNKIQALEEEIKHSMTKLTDNIEELNWQNDNIGFVLDEDHEDETYTKYYALEEAQKCIYWAWEHLDAIIEREGLEE